MIEHQLAVYQYAINQHGGDIAVTLFALIAVPSIYLICQWLMRRKKRERFRVCRPYLAIGWALWLIQLLIVNWHSPITTHYRNAAFYVISAMTTLSVGVALVNVAAIRLLLANAAERRAARLPTAAPPPDGQVWPPPPARPQP